MIRLDKCSDVFQFWYRISTLELICSFCGEVVSERIHPFSLLYGRSGRDGAISHLESCGRPKGWWNVGGLFTGPLFGHSDYSRVWVARR